MSMFGSLRYLAMMSNLNGGGSNPGGGGTGAPSDWNAKEGEAGHILNRPFYSEAGSTVIIDVELNEDDLGQIATRPVVPIVSGETYTINWNGTNYECVGQPYSMQGLDAVILGHATDFGLSSNGEPFMMMFIDPDLAESMGEELYGMVETSDEYPISLKITGFVETIHKLDEKYLPIQKTHWVNEEEVVLLPETTFTIEPSSDTMFIPIVLRSDLESGISYKVVWNGAEYICKAIDINLNGEMSIGIGDTPWVNLDSDGEYPFGLFKNLSSMMEYYSSPYLLATNENVESITISVVEPEGAVHKLDPKFLPSDNTSLFLAGMNRGSIRTSYTEKENDVYGVGQYAIASGYETKAGGDASHAEGRTTNALGDASHAEGENTLARGAYSHAEGYGPQTIETLTITGDSNGKVFSYSNESIAPQKGRLIGTSYNISMDDYIDYRVITDVDTINKTLTLHDIISDYELPSGIEVRYFRGIAAGSATHSEGTYTVAYGINSHSEGSSTSACGDSSHAEGSGTVAMGDVSHAEGSGTVASNRGSHAEGNETKATGSHSHAEGNRSVASGGNSHAEGESTIASGYASHAEGRGTRANTAYLSVSGQFNEYEAKDTFIIETEHIVEESLSGDLHILTGTPTFDSETGIFTFETKTRINAEDIKAGDVIFEPLAYVDSESVTRYFEIIRLVKIGEGGGYFFEVNKYEAIDTRKLPGKYLDMVGNGYADTRRSNAYTLDWDGNVWFAGTVEGTGMIVKSTTSGSSKRFMITVDDTGTIKATEVTE